MRVLAWMVALAAVLAGCTGSSDVPADDALPTAGQDGPMSAPDEPASATEGDSAAEPLAFTDCLQFHASYVGMASDFQDRVPAGFQLVEDTGGVVYVYAFPSACTLDGGPSAQMWIALDVIPPDGLAEEGSLQMLALEAYADPDLAEALHGLGVDVVVPCTCSAESLPGSEPGFTVESADQKYTITTALSPSSDAFDMPRMWMYIAHDGVATQRVLFGDGASTEVGFGESVLTHQGAGGAPPVYPGYSVHVIHDLSFDLTVEELEVA